MPLTTTVKRNIRRTPYQAFAATMVMFFTFLVLSVFMVVAFGSQQILRFYEGKPQAIAFFKDGTSSNDIKVIQNALNQTGRITAFKYVSKEDALQIYRDRNKNNPLLLELVTANILPASLEISTVSPEDLKPVAEILKKEPVVEDVVFPEDVVTSLTQATRLIRIIGSTIVGFLITFSTLIIIMIIGFKIRIRRDEIAIMKLLGASSWFIRMPFLSEGILYAVVGAFVAWVITFITIWYFQPILINSLEEASSVIFPVSWLFIGGILMLELLIALVVGSLGSMVAVRRYLRL